MTTVIKGENLNEELDDIVESVLNGVVIERVVEDRKLKLNSSVLDKLGSTLESYSGSADSLVKAFKHWTKSLVQSLEGEQAVVVQEYQEDFNGDGEGSFKGKIAQCDLKRSDNLEGVLSFVLECNTHLNDWVFSINDADSNRGVVALGAIGDNEKSLDSIVKTKYTDN